MVRRVRFFTMLFLSVLVLGGKVFASSGMKVTNEMIYAKLLEIEKRQAILEAQFREFKEQVDKRFEQVDKRFEDMNKRFEDMNKRFDQLYTFLWIITGIFTAIMVGAFGFAYWDRRTIITEAKRQVYDDMEKEFKPEKFRKVLSALRELAKNDKRVEEILKREGLL